MAEEMKIEVGSALPMEKPLRMEIRGRDIATGMPRSLVVSSNDIAEAIKPTLGKIILAIKRVLEETPPELSSDVMDRGITMSGGTAQLRNLDLLFTKATGVPAHVADDPLYCVAMGTGEALKNLDVLKRSLM
jgi:rod shape-determining protein MreB